MKAYNNVNDSRIICETRVPIYYKLRGNKIVVNTSKLKKELDSAVSRIERTLTVINGRIERWN